MSQVDWLYKLLQTTTQPDPEIEKLSLLRLPMLARYSDLGKIRFRLNSADQKDYEVRRFSQFCNVLKGLGEQNSNLLSLALLQEIAGDLHMSLELRSKSMSIRALSGDLMDSNFPAPEHLESLFKTFLEWRDQFPVSFTRGLLSHFMILTLHPFTDGNGRLARLMEFCDFRNAAPWPSELCSEFLVHWEFQSYFSALKQSRLERDIGLFIEFMRGLFLTVKIT
jgi:Fic family protein